MSFFIYKGDRPSDGARTLAATLGATVLKSAGSTYRGRRGTKVINWGSTSAEAQRLYDLAPEGFNNPASVAVASNKLKFFKLLSDVAPGLVVPHVTDINAALALIENGGRVFARTVLNGHSGAGIHMMVSMADGNLKALRTISAHNVIPMYVSGGEVPQALRDCKLFTQGIIGKRSEYRVHVFRGEVILTQIKMRVEGAQELPAYNSVVRNLASGWIYGVNNIPEEGLEEVHRVAQATLAHLQLDFGAIDVVYKADTRQAFVLEVNTAPGLAEEGSAVKAYTDAFQGA